MLIGDCSSSCCETTCWPAMVATEAVTLFDVASVLETAVFCVACSAVEVPVARRGRLMLSVPPGSGWEATWSATTRPARARRT